MSTPAAVGPLPAETLRHTRVAGRVLLASPLVVLALRLVVMFTDPGRGSPWEPPVADPHGYAIIFGTLLSFLALPVLLGMAAWGALALGRGRRHGAVVLGLAAFAAVLQYLDVVSIATTWATPVTIVVAVLAAVWGLVALGCLVVSVRAWRALPPAL